MLCVSTCFVPLQSTFPMFKSFTIYRPNLCKIHIYSCLYITIFITFKVLVATIDAQWEGMGDVGSVRYEPALLPPMPDHKGFKLQ